MPDGRILVMKLDNAPQASPHSGLADADMVYVEQVEGGLTRYFAVYSTIMPATIGPVRSARQTDLELIQQFGRVAFGYSGAALWINQLVSRSPVYNVSADRSGVGYHRDRSRPVPHNLFADPRALLARAPGSAVARPMGWVFDPAVPLGGSRARSVLVPYPASPARITWSPAANSWEFTFAGQPAVDVGGARLHSPTVIVQYVRVQTSSGDATSPYSRTVGSGTALVLRNGLTYSVRWSRPSASEPTHYTTAAGTPMSFDPGQVWVFLEDARRPATVTGS